MSKGIVYYTDNRLKNPIFSVIQNYISKAGLPVVSVSLQPIDFGKNFVLNLSPGYLTMIKQIIKALEKSDTDYVFFCEHDVLYPQSHFDFTPQKDTIFYYNEHVWRWKYKKNFAITYDRLISLSGLCVNREFVLNHFQKRLEKIKAFQFDKDTSSEPVWARKWGYEPGTKKIRRGGFSNDDYETWKSEIPIIDIRHRKTFSNSKVTLNNFLHPPVNWKEITIDAIPGWDLQKLFNF